MNRDTIYVAVICAILITAIAYFSYISAIQASENAIIRQEEATYKGYTCNIQVWHGTSLNCLEGKINNLQEQLNRIEQRLNNTK